MTKMTHTRSISLLLTLILLLVACAPQAAITVYITPTPPPGASAEAVQPTDTSDEVFGSDSGFTLTSMQTAATFEPHPTVTWLGPVISSGYVPPATSTPQATLTPTQPPTVEGQPTATPEGVNLSLFPNGLPDLDASKIGVQVEGNLDQADWNEVMRRMGGDQLALGWIKVQIPWKDLQPNGPNDSSTFFNQLVLFLQDAKVRHLKIMLSVAKAPAWARSTQDQDGPPDDPQTYATFLTVLINQLKGAVDAIEVWNEPNLSREWIGKLAFSGAGYMQLFDAAYQAIRATGQPIQIVTAGLAPTGDNPGTVDDRTFLSQMYAAGLGNYHDIAIGVHPYGWANAPDASCCGTAGWDDDPHFFFADTLRDYRQAMVDHGQSDLQLWVTEFGWGSWDGFPGQPPQGSEWMLRNSKWDQANYTIRAFQIGQQTPYIGPMILWNLNFATLAGLIENNDERIAYSIVVPGANGQIDNHSTGLTERPLYWMLYDAVRPDVHLPSY
jgi:hypothetical protein